MVFKIFRKRKKQMVAVLILLAMFAFIFAGILTRFQSRSRGSSRTPRVWATAWGENILDSDIDRFQSDRHILNRFLDRVLAIAETNASNRAKQLIEKHSQNAQNEILMLDLASSWAKQGGIDQAFRLIGQNTQEASQDSFAAIRLAYQQIGRTFYRDTSPDGIIRAIVLLEKAKRMDITIDDHEVNDYINNVTDQRLLENDFFEALNAVKKVRLLDKQELFSIIATELMIEKAVEALTSPIVRETPLQMWQKREPLHSKVRLELVRVPVENFVDEDAQPDEQELQKIYEEYKDADPGQGILGFRKPQRIDVQYVVARSNDYARAHAEELVVTDEEIDEYYEAHKQDFQIEEEKELQRNLPLPVGAEEGPMIPLPMKIPDLKPDADNDDSEKSEKSAEPKTNETEGPEKDATKDSKKSENSDQSARIPNSNSLEPIVTLAGTFYLLADTGADASKDQTDNEAPQDETESKPAETKPDDEEKSTSPSVAKEIEKMDESAEESSDSSSITSEEKPQTPKYKSKEDPEVREVITKILKSQKAAARIEKELESLSESMSDFRKKSRDAIHAYRKTHQTPEGDVDMAGFASQQQELTLEARQTLAKKVEELGFELKTTGLITSAQAADVPELGTAVEGGGGFTRGFASEAFGGLGQFRGRRLQGPSGGEQYLYWKIAEEPAYVPEFEEVQEEVTEVWHIQQAEEPAEQEAKNLEEAIQNLDGDFQKGFEVWYRQRQEEQGQDDYFIMSTDSFSRKQWSTDPSSAFGDTESLVDTKVFQIPGAGPEFLDAVFEMKADQIQVLPDARKKNFYVVKVIEREEPDFEQFVKDFELEVNSMLIDPSRQRRQRQRQFMRTVFDIEIEAKLERKL